MMQRLQDYLETQTQLSVNQFWESETNRDPNLYDTYIVIDLIFASGKSVRIATSPVTGLLDNNREVYYLPLLQEEPEIQKRYTFGSATSSSRNFALTIDGRHVDAIQSVLSGNMLTGIGEIALLVDGAEAKNRFLLMRGQMIGGITFGAKEELVEIELADPKITNEEIVPRHIITKDAFNEVPNDYVGRRFPEVYFSHPFVPCIKLDEFPNGPRFLIAFGSQFTVNAVYVDGVKYAPTDPDFGYTVLNENSSNGIPFTGLDFVHPANTSVTWSNQTVYADISQTGENNGLFNIVRRIIGKSNNFGIKGIDEKILAQSEAKVPFLQANCLINADSSDSMATAIKYIEQTLLDSFPMLSGCFTGYGYGLVLTDRRHQVTTAHLERGNGLIIDRVSAIKESDREELYNDFSVRYSYNPTTDNYEKVISTNSSNNALCAQSESRIGKRSYPPIDSVVIYDDATAGYVLGWLTAHMTLPSYYVEYDAVASLYFRISLGDTVTLTDDKLGITNARCTVEKICYYRGKCTIGLRAWLLYKTVVN